MTQPSAHAFRLLLDTQAGGHYLWGGKAAPSDTDPKDHGHPLDCSGLIAWGAEHLGDTQIAGNAQMIYDHCKNHGTLIPVDIAEKTDGAVGFIMEGSSIGHIVCFRGDGTTIEAKGAAWGIGHWSDSEAHWYAAAKLPGLDYTRPHKAAPHVSADDRPTLHLGDHGAAVDELQRVLNAAGARPHLDVDGDYGKKTSTAVEAFKRAHKAIGNTDGDVAGQAFWKAAK